jgi:gonadotropin-releasing hormone receptor
MDFAHLIDSLQTYIFRVERGPFVEEFYQCVTFGAYTEQWQEQLYSCLSVLLMYVLPLVTMVTAYTLIFRTIARKSRDFQNNGE